MNASIILAHPYKKSFNHAIFAAVKTTLTKNNAGYFAHDLYEEKFDPVLTSSELGKDETQDVLVKQYTKEIIASDVLIFIHPNWWGQPPAILTGYINRVIRPPHAYEFSIDDSGGGVPLGKFTGKYGLVINTSNTEENRENNYFGDPLENIWGKCIFGFCGIAKYQRKIFRIVADSTEEQRLKWLKEVEEIITELCR